MPFVRLLLFFIGGIAAEHYLLPGWRAWAITTATSFAVLFLFQFLGLGRRFRFGAWAGAAGLCCFLGLGGLAMCTRDEFRRANHISHLPETPRTYCARIAAPPEEKTASWKLTVRIERIISGIDTAKAMGTVFLYLRKTGAEPGIPSFGDRLVFYGILRPVRGLGNPGGFDYGAWCRINGITHQAFLRPGDWVSSPGKARPLPALLFRLREKILGVIRQHIPGQKEQGLAEALLIGYKNDLDRSLVKAYADTGVVHIIAISGMHVGLIYWLLNLLFRPLGKRKLMMLPALFKIILLWLFSLMAGGQPSILRATVMFSCLIIGREISGKNQVFNSVAFSAFVLLCINPRWLWDAGFQLSYAAVMGILCFHKPIYHTLFIRNRVLDSAWNMSAITLSAQLLTLPLCLYYFHQFPNFFLLTNFIAVPLSGLILFGEIFLLFVSFAPPIAQVAGLLLSWTIARMNDCMEFFARLPGARWAGIQISITQVTCLFVFILGLSAFLMHRARGAMLAALISLSVFIIIRTQSFYTCARQRMLVVYNTYGKTAIDEVRGRAALFSGDSTYMHPSPEREFMIDPSRVHMRISATTIPPATSLSRWQVGSQKIIRTHQSWRPVRNLKLPTDILIISGKKIKSMADLEPFLPFQYLVADPSVPPYAIRRLREECLAAGIRFHDTRQQGAFVLRGW